MTQSWSGLNTLEHMAFTALFQHEMETRTRVFNPNAQLSYISDIYYCMGLYLDSTHDTIKCQTASVYNEYMELDMNSEKFKTIRAFVNGENLFSFKDERKSIKNIFKVHEFENIFMVNELQAETRQLMNLIRSMLALSMNKFVDYWENVIAPSTSHDISKELKVLRDISDNYFTASDYVFIVNMLLESNNYTFNNEFFDKSTAKRAAVHEKYKMFFNRVFNLFNGGKIGDRFNLVSFKNDIAVIQSTLLSLTNKYPKLFNALNIEEIQAVKYMNSKDSVTVNETIDEIYNLPILAKYSPSNGQYHSIMFFYDHSVLAQRHINGPFELVYDYKSIPSFVNEAFSQHLKNMTRKSPTISKYFLAGYKTLFDYYTEKDEKSPYCRNLFVGCNHTLRDYYEHENILKVNNYNILDVFDNPDDYERWCERVTDKMYMVVKKHAISKYSKALFSNKYRHLYSDNLLTIFNELYRLDIPCSYIQDTVGKKMASFKTPDELYAALDNMLNLLDNFSFDMVMDNVKKLNADVISSDDNKLLIRINTFEESKLLGSSSWCISREESHFLNYTGNNNQQYFMYNFNKQSRDNDCLIGCTLGSNLKLKVAHYKNDQEIYEDDSIDYIINKVKGYKKQSMASLNFIQKIRHVAKKTVNVFQ
jgi:hypothetical protein